jgi:signal recognition particle receptor subunit beta
VQEAQEELFGLMNNELLRNVKLLVYANKQDLPYSMNTAELVDKMQLHTRFRTYDWHVQGAVATTGEGLYERLDWFEGIVQYDK